MTADRAIGLWPAVLMILPLITRLFFDYLEIMVYKTEVRHKTQAILTGIQMLSFSYIASSLEPVEYWKAMVLSWATFWLIFDYALNLLRGEKWHYIDLGKDGKRSLFDSIYERAGVLGTLFLKLWFFLFAIYAYFFWSYTEL